MAEAKACAGLCTVHGAAFGGSLCEMDAGHSGDHECQDCPGYRARQRHQMITDRVAAHQALHDSGFVTTPDED